MEHETRVMNTEEIEREMSNLSPCKHCGSTTAPRLISRQDFEVEHGSQPARTDRASGCSSGMDGYAVICSSVSDPPGCGAMTGWGGTNENNWTMNGEESAITAWNRVPDRDMPEPGMFSLGPAATLQFPHWRSDDEMAEILGSNPAE